MWAEEEKLARDFADVGLKRGDIVLLHTSLKRVGYLREGPEALIKALLGLLGEDGTLMVPTLTGKRRDCPEAPPVFDVGLTPCWTGIIPETVRKRENAVRSLHPTHSVAAEGREKYALTKGHELSYTPCDCMSPYYKNAVLNGKILLVGVDLESNTTIHTCEELAGVPYHLQASATEALIKDYDGREITVLNRLHNWDKPATDFNKIEGLYSERGIIRHGRIGNAPSMIMQAASVVECTVSLLKSKPYFFVV